MNIGRKKVTPRNCKLDWRAWLCRKLWKKWNAGNIHWNAGNISAIISIARSEILISVTIKAFEIFRKQHYTFRTMIFRYKKKYVDHKEDGNAFSCPCKKKNKKSQRKSYRRTDRWTVALLRSSQKTHWFYWRDEKSYI